MHSRKTVKYHAYHDIIDCLTTALEARDIYTGGHSSRVGDMTHDLAKAMGFQGTELDEIHIAAHLHDVGKLGVPETILNKPGKLTPDEFKEIQRHPEIGWQILSKARRLRRIAEIVLYHHERWDGKGYPSGIAGDRIPPGARIIALADSIDAMTSDRPYRTAMNWNRCRDEIIQGMGTQFEPAVVSVAIKNWKQLIKKYAKAVPEHLEEENTELLRIG